MLGTAIVSIDSASKGVMKLRALCDNGLQVNLISQRAFNRLGIEKVDGKEIQFVGVNGRPLGKSLGEVNLRIILPESSNPIQAQFHVLKTITNYSPFKAEATNTFMNLDLADPGFNEPGEIELLLGVKVWIKVLKAGLVKDEDENWVAQNSKLGWIVFRTLTECEDNYIGSVKVQESIDGLREQLEKFWVLEDIPGRGCIWTREEKLCEDIFEKNHRRDKQGRYIVRLPFNDKIGKLGKSKRAAINQFFAMERKMARNAEFAQKYREFMAEYEALGHMRKVTEESESGYYTPHHGVLSSKKFRIVFNASALTTSGISLNEAQLVGPKLQRDIFDILLEFRQGKYGKTGDIAKMYRQILVHKDDLKYQKIIWRAKQEEPLDVYVLQTVTYGHAAAPHCAIRTLYQCASDHEREFPTRARVIRNNFYVDDMIISAHSEEEMMEIEQEVQGLLKKGEMEVTKWRSNCKGIGEAEIKSDGMKPVLGLLWDTERDEFRFKIEQRDKGDIIWTKRRILSEIGRIFDPLGLITPITFLGKTIMQELWRAKSGWDEVVEEPLLTSWNDFYRELPLVDGISIPRWIHMERDSAIVIHGFCDASKAGYGVIVYSSITNSEGENYVELLGARSRVAPLKEQTIPRLELCAANQLVEFLDVILNTFSRERISEVHLWSDSQITLYWIHRSIPKKGSLKVFVSNRVSNILGKSSKLGAKWHWISGLENPADIASRGMNARELANSSTWWNGPEWIGKERAEWPADKIELNLTEQDLELAEVEIKGIHQVNIRADTGLMRGPGLQSKGKRRESFPLL